MQDRFKFRFWHKPTKKMLDVYGFNDDFVFAKTLDGVGTEYNPAKQEDCILVQCTGLKDRNGKLIYEGDILKNIYSGRKYTIKYEKYTIKYGEYNLIIAGPDGINKLSEIPLHGNYEVIGNIYENPDLLTAEKP